MIGARDFVFRELARHLAGMPATSVRLDASAPAAMSVPALACAAGAQTLAITALRLLRIDFHDTSFMHDLSYGAQDLFIAAAAKRTVRSVRPIKRICRDGR